MHLTYIRNGTVAGVEDAVMWAYSPDGGKTFNPPAVVGANGGFNLRIAAGADHGGFVLSDDNSGGPIKAFTLAAGGSPAGGGGNDGGGPAPAGCKQLLQVTATVQARSQGGCWSKDGGTRWTTKADARINGIDFQTGGSGATVSVDTSKNTIETKGGVSQKAGAVVLNKGPVTWDLDGTTKFSKVDAFGIKLLGFAVTGEATVTFQKDAASILTNIKLPAPLDVATGSTTMRTTMSSGLKLDGLTVKVPSTAIGPLGIKDLEVAYTGAGVNTLEGRADFLLPPQKSKLLRVGFGFKDGKFAHAEIPFYNGPPLPLPLAAGDVLLNSIGFGVSVADGFRLNGQVAVAAGNFGSLKAVNIDGSFVFNIPKGSDVAQFDANGKLSVLSLPLANGHVRFRTDGIFQFDGGITLGPLDGSVAGGIDVSNGDFFATGTVSACLFGGCASGEAIVSSIGAAGGVTILGTCVGAGIKWPDDFVTGCSLDDFKPAQVGARALRQAGGSGTPPPTVQVRAGLDQAALRVRGEGGVPAVQVDLPGGGAIASDPGDPNAPQGRQGVLLLPDPATNSVQVLVQKPAAGAFAVTRTGGAAIAGIDSATGAPLPQPKGTLRGKGRTRTLSYTGAAKDDVRFVERGAGGLVQDLGAAKGATGSLRFTMQDGPAGKRTIDAVVSRSGLPRKRVTVATYTAPGPITPARPKVEVQRRGSRLAVSWTKAANATRYRVQVRMPDGRRLLSDQTARTYRVPRLERDDRVTVTVRGVSSRGRLGRTATATLKPAKKARRR